MVTFVLPGYSLHNKDWSEETAKLIKAEGEIRPVYWNHWEDSTKRFDPKEKVRLIVDVARQNSINIIAKSIGTLVASYIIEQVPDRIEKVIFCGIPIDDLNEGDKEVYREVLRNFAVEKILCIQNEGDPHGTFNQVKDFLAKINPEIKVVSMDRSDHEYPFYNEFQGFLSG
jgi:predicted alpha/beta-hydrolase family hydrolase